MAPNLRLDNAVRNAADSAAQALERDGSVIPGEKVLLSSSSDTGISALTLRGFGTLEPDGAWTVGAVARVEVRLRGVLAGERYRLVLEALPFEAQGHRALIGMSINGTPSHQVLRQGQGWQTIEADCQIKMSGSKGSLLVEFQIANPMSPSALNMGNDERALGMKLGTLRVEALSHAAAANVVEDSAATPIEVEAGVHITRPVIDALPQPDQLIRQLASRGPLWRKLLLDKNPLVRVVRWMRRMSHGMIAMQEQLDLIRLDSARQSYELAERIGQAEAERRSEELEKLRADTRLQLEEGVGSMERLHRQLHHETRTAYDLIHTAQGDMRNTFVGFARDLARLKEDNSALQAEVHRFANVVPSTDRLVELINAAYTKIDQASLVLANTQAKIDQANLALAHTHFKIDQGNLALTQTHSKIDQASLALTRTTAQIDQANLSLGQIDQAVNVQGQMLSALPANILGVLRDPLRRVLRTSNGWIIDTGFGHFSCDERDDLLATCLAEYGDVERGLRLLLDRVLKSGDVFIDVGANIGLHTVVGARAVGLGGHVYAIEAMPRTLEHLRATLRLSMVEQNVTVLPVAAGARAEDAREFHIGVVSGHSSLYTLPEEVASIQVDIRSLDSLVNAERVKLVKIDVEGAELEVIEGMAETIARNPDILIIAEYALSHLRRVGTDPEMWEHMRQMHGFNLYLVDDLTGGCLPIQDFSVLDERISSNVLMCRADNPWLKLLSPRGSA